VEEGKQLHFVILEEYHLDPGHSRWREDHILQGVLLKLCHMQGEVLEAFKGAEVLQLDKGLYIVDTSRII
jgi:hypothetical protein